MGNRIRKKTTKNLDRKGECMMGTKMKKMVVLSALSLLALSSLASLPYAVNAVGLPTIPDEKSLVIHKIENDNDTIYENDGENRPGTLTGDYLPGAGFTVVDVSNDYYAIAGQASNVGKTPKEIYDAYFATIKHESNTQIRNRGTIFGSEVLDSADGNEDGQISFSNLPTKNNGRDAIYVVVETTRSANTVTTHEGTEVASKVIGTIPVLIAMPLNGASNTINIYPKNEVGRLTKDLTDVTNDSHVSVAQDIFYDIKLKLPRDLGTPLAPGNPKYKSFTVNEIPGLGLVFAGYDPNVTMVNDGATDRTLADFLTYYGLKSVANPATGTLVGDGSTKASLTVSPDPLSTGTEAWADLASKELTFTIKAWVNEAYFEANPDKILDQINNKANYKITEDNGFEVVPDEDDVDTDTAKYKFQKNDANTGHPLTGAVFKVTLATNGATQYFKEIGTGTGVYMLTNAPAPIYVEELTVGSDGTLTLLGLDEDLSYNLNEITAPAGYSLLNSPIVFTPDHDDDDDFTTDLAVNNADNFHNVYNIPSNILPSTGGRGFAIFGLVAVAGLGGASVLYYLKRKNAQEAA